MIQGRFPLIKDMESFQGASYYKRQYSIQQLENLFSPVQTQRQLYLNKTVITLKQKVQDVMEIDIQNSFERVLNLKLDPNFSDSVRNGRQKVLEYAQQDRSINKASLSEQLSKLTKDPLMIPSAIAILYQIGEYQKVIEMGDKALESEQLKEYERDIILSQVLALCSLAAQMIQSNFDQLVTSFESLMQAEQMLSQFKDPLLAPELKQDIMDSIQDLTPQYLIKVLQDQQQLNSERGIWAVEQFQVILQDIMKNKVQMSKSDVNRIVQNLPAPRIASIEYFAALNNQTELLQWIEPDVQAYIGQCFVIQGFLEKDPFLVKVGLKYYQELSKSYDVRVQLAVCYLLLGKIDESNASIQQAAPNQVAGSLSKKESINYNKAVEILDKNFSDMLLGLCIISQSWIQNSIKEVYPKYIQDKIKQQQLTLNSYFNDTDVQKLLDSTESQGVLNTKKIQVKKFFNLFQGQPLLQQAQQSLDAASSQAKIRATSQKALFPILGCAILIIAILAKQAFSKGHNMQTQSDKQSKAQSTNVINKNAQRNNIEQHSQAYINGKHLPRKYRIDKGQAEHLVKQWQLQKHSILAQSHDISHLDQFLAGQMYDNWSNTATVASNLDSYYTHTLKKCKVLNVDHSNLAASGSGYVEITAQIAEDGKLTNKAGKITDKFQMEYEIKYEVANINQGWRLTRSH